MNALMFAAKESQAEIVKLLLAKGANPRAQAEGGWTPLTWAAWGGNPLVVGLLKSKKSEQTLPDLVCLGDVGRRRLIKKGADVNATGPRFATLLMCAVRTGRLEMVNMLLDNGADINAALDDGTTALRTAKEKGYKQIADLLRARGAEE